MCLLVVGPRDVAAFAPVSVSTEGDPVHTIPEHRASAALASSDPAVLYNLWWRNTVRIGPLAIALLAVSAHAVEAPKVGQPAPEILLDLLLPERPATDATLHALAGKGVVLDFWATWCGPCVASIPHLNELAAKFKDRPVVFLSVTDEQRPVIEEFLKKRPIQGWVGIANGAKLSKSYGVEGIPDTFLIDAAGKVAANLYPEELKPEMIEDLLAGRPVKAPPRMSFDFSVKRSDESGGPAPLADLIIRPSSTANTGMSSGKGKLVMKGGEVAWFFSAVFETPQTRVVGEALNDHTHYDLSISLPGSSESSFHAVARELLCAAFKLKAERETRDADVLVLTAPNGKLVGIAESDGYGGSSWNSSNRKIQMTNCGMEQLASAMESAIGKPVIDETRIGTRYDFTLNYDHPEGMLEAVRKLGLQVETTRRPIEFLVVSPAR